MSRAAATIKAADAKTAEAELTLHDEPQFDAAVIVAPPEAVDTAETLEGVVAVLSCVLAGLEVLSVEKPTTAVEVPDWRVDELGTIKTKKLMLAFNSEAIFAMMAARRLRRSEAASWKVKETSAYFAAPHRMSSWRKARTSLVETVMLFRSAMRSAAAREQTSFVAAVVQLRKELMRFWRLTSQFRATVEEMIELDICFATQSFTLAANELAADENW